MDNIKRKKNTGEPGNPGQFGSKQHSEAEVHLTSVPDPIPNDHPAVQAAADEVERNLKGGSAIDRRVVEEEVCQAIEVAVESGDAQANGDTTDIEIRGIESRTGNPILVGIDTSDFEKVWVEEEESWFAVTHQQAEELAEDAPRVHVTTDDAKQEIVAAIEATGVVRDAHAEYDVDAIADEVLTRSSGGVSQNVSEEDFWAAVARHER